MGERGTITMSMKEAQRLHIVRKAIEKRITQMEAARIIGLDLRQVQRIIQRIRQEGDETFVRARAKGLITGSRTR
jgi:DNA-binding GntR family transcriptional regulator